MLEELEVHDGMRVLEIGTGTGYSTALLCRRLGSENVASVEYDPEVARRAAAGIHSVGFNPTLITGDGLDGHAKGAPYDRIIATCAVRAIPSAWLDQAKPGAVVLATLTGSLHGHGLAKLTVNDDGTAEGVFMPGYTSFMLARPQVRELNPHINILSDIPNRPTTLNPDIFDDWTGRFIAQLSAPDVIHTHVSIGAGSEISYLAAETGDSAANVTQNGDGWQVRQAGSRRIWDEIETAIGQWRAAGSPILEKFRIHTDGHTQTVWAEGTDLRYSSVL